MIACEQGHELLVRALLTSEKVSEDMINKVDSVRDEEIFLKVNGIIVCIYLIN